MKSRPSNERSLASLATGRKKSFFAADLAEQAKTLRAEIKGKRLLVLGGAGSIGSNTIKALQTFAPKSLVVLDQNENALAELVRQMRSGSIPLTIDDFRTLPLDYGAPATRLLLESEKPFDLVLNFAAIKHVRSEKDVFSILQMFDTNIVKQARFMRWLGQYNPDADYFSVSTDKAANPVSFMGASKRMMEHVMFNETLGANIKGRITSARFANVAFSNGSLLQSFENRLARGEPLACPKDIKRYFVSLEESGQICALAALLGPKDTIMIPDLSPEEHLVPLKNIADNFLRHHGHEPNYYDGDDDAKAGLEADRASGKYPLILTPADTAGEKPYEEFVGTNESVADIGLKAMKGVPYLRNVEDRLFNSVLERIENHVLMAKASLGQDKDSLKALIGEVEPAFLKAHIDSKLNLDQRV